MSNTPKELNRHRVNITWNAVNTSSVIALLAYCVTHGDNVGAVVHGLWGWLW